MNNYVFESVSHSEKSLRFQFGIRSLNSTGTVDGGKNIIMPISIM